VRADVLRPFRGLGGQSLPCPCPACTVASGKRIPQIANGLLLRARDLLGPGSQAGAERVRPLIHHLEDDAPAFPSHQDLALSREPTLLREPDRLTAAILEELRASRFHGVSLDACLYVVKLHLASAGSGAVSICRLPQQAPVSLGL